MMYDDMPWGKAVKWGFVALTLLSPTCFSPPGIPTGDGHPTDLQGDPMTDRPNPGARASDDTSRSRATLADPALVDPLIGTGGLGYGVGSIVPGATLPFGMVKLSPDTTAYGVAPGFDHCGGYWYPDPQIRGFSHNHLSGTGAADQGNIRVMPLLRMTPAASLEAGYRSEFSHETEAASPGYYSVLLERSGILAELSVTERAGIHRYTFPEGDRGTILFDISAVLGESSASDIDFTLDPVAGTLSGTMTNHGSLSSRYGGQPIYFAARIRAPVDDFGVFADGHLYPSQVSDEPGEHVGAWFSVLLPDSKAVELVVGISYISEDQAALNLAEEIGDASFDDIRARAEETWRGALARIDVEGGSENDRRIFYTALYHSMMMPTLYTDVNGLYMGFDGGIHQADDFTYYTDFSLWDTFRTLHPLLAFLDPARHADFNRSLMAMQEQIGFFDRWPQGNGPTGSMVGDSAANVLADSYLRGVRGFDADAAFDALWRQATLEDSGWHRDDLEDYLELGYVPIEAGDRATSETLEYAWNDAALAAFARAMGLDAEADAMRTRALSYRNHFNPDTGFLQGRYADGRFETPFTPHAFLSTYAEGNALQWSWYALHDGSGLVELFGGADVFERRLDEFFERSALEPDTLLPDRNYWHGNEPDLHAAWLYHFVGKPEKTSTWVRWIGDRKYGDGPDGLDGNDDGGALSSWYVWSASGLYPLSGTDLILIATPRFTRITFHRDEGDFVVVSDKDPETYPYIVGARLNGQTLDRAWLRHSEIAEGGTLELTLGLEPAAWGREDLPPSLSDGDPDRR